MGDCELFPKMTLEMYVKAFFQHEEESIARWNGMSVWVGKNDLADCPHFKVVVELGPKGHPHHIARQFKPCFVTMEKAEEWAREIKRRFVQEFRERGVPAEMFEEGAWN